MAEKKESLELKLESSFVWDISKVISADHSDKVGEMVVSVYVKPDINGRVIVKDIYNDGKLKKNYFSNSDKIDYYAGEDKKIKSILQISERQSIILLNKRERRGG